jgi:hypothetical protein
MVFFTQRRIVVKFQKFQTEFAKRYQFNNTRLQTQNRRGKSNAAVAQAFRQILSHISLHGRVGSAIPRLMNPVSSSHEPGGTPDRAGHLTPRGFITNTALYQMTPGTTPGNKSRMVPVNLFVPRRQKGEPPPGNSPSVQRINHCRLIQWPVQKIDITQNDFRPSVCGGTMQGVFNKRLKLNTPGKSSARQKATLVAGFH